MTAPFPPAQNVWTHCPACGSKAVRTGNSPFRCEVCQYTHYFSPCCAVGAIIRNREREILFLVRAKDPGKGMLGIPGGFVDPGESVDDALRREVFEETNLKLDRCEYLVSFPNVYHYGGAAVSVADIFFVAEATDLSALKWQPDEVNTVIMSEATPDCLNRMAFASNRRAIQFLLDRESRD